MRSTWVVACVLAMFAACASASEIAPAPATPEAIAPLRGAAGDSDLRVMLSELASSKACAMVRGGYRGLRAPDRPEVVTGVLWIRECEITNVGARVKFQLSGNGWAWVDQTRSKGGGTFTVKQYVRFRIGATIRGELDVAYDPDAHVATVWFTPDKPLDVEFKTIGAIDVDSEGMWSSMVGALGSAFATSPEDAARVQTKLRGKRELSAILVDGLAVTIDLCTGLTRVHLGRPAKGEMGVAGVGETYRVPVELKPGGVMLIGPQQADKGMTLRATASKGVVRLSLVCADQAESIAAAYLRGRALPDVPTLGRVDLRSDARLEIEPTTCPVVAVIYPLGDTPVRFAWERPTAEIARSTGGPLIRCDARHEAVD
ncbi:MAG TPA: hypothetical protein VM513_00470 [Kofleriaceae bacterium]|nr:hypothetical protein [Kofleriaceae bacterium]